MCLVRLLRFLNLHKVSQISFAEYHSKRNYVERVHAEENRVLSKHGPFKSNSLHRHCAPGSSEHRKNMEYMCEQASRCLQQAFFGGKSLLCHRGITADDFIFSDVENLQTFLGLSKDYKPSYKNRQYSANNNPLLESLHITWGVDIWYCDDYSEDYKILTDAYSEDSRTAWVDKYTTVVYSPLPNIKCDRYELQPLPDYPRWMRTGKLHYLPWEERDHLENGVWNNVQGMFLPTTVLDLCFRVLTSPPQDVMELIALLAWVPTSKVTEYYSKLDRQMDNVRNTDQQREQWKQHPLYINNTKQQLEAMCCNFRLPVTSSVNKHELVKLILDHKHESPPQMLTLYCGKLALVPSTTTAISRLPISKLRGILHYHGIMTLGIKEELVLRVFLLKQGRTAAMFAKEAAKLKDLIRITEQLILSERTLDLMRPNHTYFRRTHSCIDHEDNLLEVPPHIKTLQDLSGLYRPLLEFINIVEKTSRENDERSTGHLNLSKKSGLEVTTSTKQEQLKEQISAIGSQIKVKWGKEELGNTGWQPGWYVADVQSYDTASDVIHVVYPSEPKCFYDIELTPALSSGKLKLVRAAI